MSLVLKGSFQVVSIEKKSGAKMFKELKVGDIVDITKVLCSESPRFDVTRASYCEVKNHDTGETVRKSFAELQNIMKAFEWRQI